MQVYCLTGLDELSPYAEDWDRLAADMLPRGWDRLSNWWRDHESEPSADEGGSQLMVLCVFDPLDNLLGIAPWYVTRSATQGWTLRSLGSGEGDTAEPGILCRPGSEGPVTEALGDYLTIPSELYSPDRLRWDLLELTADADEETVVGRLARSLADRGASVYSRPGNGFQTVFIEVVPDRTGARLRHQLCLAGSHVRHWLKGDLQD
jgi:hypothetical protein